MTWNTDWPYDNSRHPFNVCDKEGTHTTAVLFCNGATDPINVLDFLTSYTSLTGMSV